MNKRMNLLQLRRPRFHRGDTTTKTTGRSFFRTTKKRKTKESNIYDDLSIDSNRVQNLENDLEVELISPNARHDRSIYNDEDDLDIESRCQHDETHALAIDTYTVWSGSEHTDHPNSVGNDSGEKEIEFRSMTCNVISVLIFPFD